jgi:hypothetical protein
MNIKAFLFYFKLTEFFYRCFNRIILLKNAIKSIKALNIKQIKICFQITMNFIILLIYVIFSIYTSQLLIFV